MGIGRLDPIGRGGSQRKENGLLDNDSNLDLCCTLRNYRVFAVLADVRNGLGFNPIDYPRGLPDDVTEEVKEESDSYGEDGHSHSYLTLREIKEFDWDGQFVDRTDFIPMSEYMQFKANGKLSKCDWGFFSGCTFLSNEQMDNLIAQGNVSDQFYTSVQWKQSYRDAVSPFCENDIPILEILLGKDGDEDDLRIVFFFDN